MSLLEIRQKFLEASGRADLVNASTYANLGADWFIQAGQRFLDRRLSEEPRLYARHSVSLPSGSYFTYFRHCRVIHEVWIANAEGRTKLRKMTQTELRELYPDIYDGSLDTTLTPPIQNTAMAAGKPLYWAPLIIQAAPDLNAPLDNGVLSFRFDFDGIVLGEGQVSYRGIYLLPVMDEEYTVTVIGKFQQPRLSSDDDTNFWTEEEPDLLIFAAMYKLEGFYRNREGSRDWLEQIDEGLRGLEYDDAENDSVESNVMEG